MREPISRSLRRRVFLRDGRRCRYCGSTKGPFEIDHVYPVSKGGENSLGNLVVACERCNLEKGSTVGIWPKPLGYWKLKKENDRSTRRFYAALLFALSGIWLMAYSLIRARGDDRYILIGSVMIVIGLVIETARKLKDERF